LALLLAVIQLKYTNADAAAGTSASDSKKADSASSKDKTAKVDDNSSGASKINRNSQSSSSGSQTKKKRPKPDADIVLDWADIFPPSITPSASPAFLGNPYANNEPSCFPLLDTQYPLFADMCGALPQVRYSLPNSFGHYERWQISQVLSTILGSPTVASTTSLCRRSLRLLICPLLFPPCPSNYEPTPVVPCQQFCQAVKSQCTAPSLDLLPCDFLPVKSDLCPATPAPFSSMFTRYQQAYGTAPAPQVQNHGYPYLQQFSGVPQMQQPQITISLPAPPPQPQPQAPVLGDPATLEQAYSHALLRTLFGQNQQISPRFIAPQSYTPDVSSAYLVNLPHLLQMQQTKK
jgi:hypothetical protein